MKSFATLALLSGIAVAQTTTMDVFLIPTGYSASVVNVDATATTLVLSCPTDAPEDDDEMGCFPDDFTVTAGPSLLYAEFSEMGTVATVSCKIEGTTSAGCVQSMTGSADGSAFASATSIDFDGILEFSPVTITAGADKLSPATGSAKPTPETTPERSAASSDVNTGSLITRTAPAPTTTGTSPTGTSATTGGSAPTDTGAASANLVRSASIAGLAGVAAAMLAL